MSRLGLDIDGCIYKWEDTARFLLKHEFDIDIVPSETWDWIEEHVSPMEWKWLWTEGVKRGLYVHGSVYKGSIEVIRELHERGHDIVLITARPRFANLDTFSWVAHHKIPASEVHILHQRAKSTVSPQCDIYVDDGPENLKDLLHNTQGVVIRMNRPWNMESKDWHLEADSWEEVRRAVEQASC